MAGYRLWDASRGASIPVHDAQIADDGLIIVTVDKTVFHDASSAGRTGTALLVVTSPTAVLELDDGATIDLERMRNRRTAWNDAQTLISFSYLRRFGSRSR